MADYWRHFSHRMNGDYVLSQLELASRLLQIIIKNGNEGEDMERLPARVKLRNKERFKVRHHGGGFYLGEEQEVRFNKAFCILFRLLQDNMVGLTLRKRRNALKQKPHDMEAFVT